jgi:hypothetical protein
VTRNRSSAKAAGSRFEKSIADAFAWHLKDDRIERRVTNGARDRGDIGGVRTASGQRLTVEAKDYGGRLLPAQWIREAKAEAVNDGAAAGVVVAKRLGTTEPLEQYVIMDVETLFILIQGAHHADV